MPASSHLVSYREAQDALMATPPSLPADFLPDVPAARRIVESVIGRGASWLDPVEAAACLPPTRSRSPQPCRRPMPRRRPRLRRRCCVAAEPWWSKILSPDIVHKSEVGGVQLNLSSASAVRGAVSDMLARAQAMLPQARIDGVTIHPMIVRPKAHELIAGIADDPTFGPVIVFGGGGTAVEVINDKALALPPLDLGLARDLMAQTRVSRILGAYRDVPAVDQNAVALVLVKLAQLAADVAEIRELDINPLLADETGLIAVDVRIAVAPVEAGAGRGRGLHPVRRAALSEAVGTPPQDARRHKILVRPVRPEDERHCCDGFSAAFPLRISGLRFFAPVRDFSHTFIARLTQIDYARAMAFIAIEEAPAGCSAWCGCTPTRTIRRRIRHSGALRPQGPRTSAGC